MDLEEPRAHSVVRRLPISTGEVMAGLGSKQVANLETRYGNGNLIKGQEILGLAGPLTVKSPWELTDERGRHLINAGGFAALPFGEMYPPLIDFLHRYLEENRSLSLPQQTAADWRAALESNLVMLLSQEAPSHEDSQVFFSNSGAGAVEAAIKFVRAARPGAETIINFSRSYHGKTLGALSLTPNESYQTPFRPLMSGVVTLPYGDSEALRDAVQRLGSDRIAAIFLEPVQGEAGVIHPPVDFLPLIETLRREYGIVVVADEIQTGLGRTGHLFASLAGGLEPDIITLAKPLGGGMVPVGATIARKWIIKKTLGGLDFKRHSNTFGGGSLAMAVGLKSLEIIVEEGLIERSRQLGERGLARLESLQTRYPRFFKEVRGAGMLFALQCQPLIHPKLLPNGFVETARVLGGGLVTRALHEGGIHACYTQNAFQIVRLTPALTMPEPLFDEMFDRLERVAKGHTQAWRMLTRTHPRVLVELSRLSLD